MQRKPTRNASAVAAKMMDDRLRREFACFMRAALPGEKNFLLEVLEDFNSTNTCKPPAIGIASAFELCITNSFGVVVPQDEYDSLLKRLDEAEAFRKKIVVMPARDAA